MQAAAQDIRTVSLELGGKSPFVVFADCNLEKAVEWMMFGILWNQGQVCSATSRLLVERSVYEPLLVRLQEAAAQIMISNGADEGVLLGPLVSNGQYAKVIAAIDAAQADGVRLVTGGDRPTGTAKGYFVQPTVFADAPVHHPL